MLTQRKTKTTTEIFNVDKNRDKTKTSLQQVWTSFPKKKKEISPKLSASTIGKKAIMPTDILQKKDKSQKTADNFGNLYAGDCS